MLHIRKKGFTLLELLFVISIIALLVSMLIPSLKNAKEQAQKILCLSNQHQIGTAMNMYVSDYSGTLPPLHPQYDSGGGHFRPSSSSNPYGREYFWQFLIKDYVGDSEAQGGLFLCPCDEDGPRTWHQVSYGVNYGQLFRFGNLYSSFSGTDKIENIPNPSNIFMLMDAEFLYVYTPVRWPFVQDANLNGINDSVTLNTQFNHAELRHNDNIGVLYVDGHSNCIDEAEWSEESHWDILP